MVGGSPGRFNNYPWRLRKWLFGNGHEEQGQGHKEILGSLPEVTRKLWKSLIELEQASIGVGKVVWVFWNGNRSIQRRCSTLLKLV